METTQMDRALNRACLFVGVAVIALMLAILFLGTANADGRDRGGPPSEPVRYVTHNGSLMQVQTFGPTIEIRYIEPRPSLWPWGVRPGTLLIVGRWNGPVLNATAHVFGCGPVPYPVQGGVGPDGVLVLQGPAPVVDVYGCTVVAWGWTSNSTLVFVPEVPR